MCRRASVRHLCVSGELVPFYTGIHQCKEQLTQGHPPFPSSSKGQLTSGGCGGRGWRRRRAVPLPSQQGTTLNISPESQGRNVALTVLQVPCSLGNEPSERVDDAVRVSFFFFIFTLVTGPRRSLSLTLSDTKVYEP